MAAFFNLKGDLSGAGIAAIITMPQCIGYGIMVFAPLGVDFAPSGALPGLYPAVFAGFFAACFGGNPIQTTGPKAPSTFAMASVAAVLAANHLRVRANLRGEGPVGCQTPFRRHLGRGRLRGPYPALPGVHRLVANGAGGGAQIDSPPRQGALDECPSQFQRIAPPGG